MATCSILYGFGAANGDEYKGEEGFFIYVLPQIIWLIKDLIKEKKVADIRQPLDANTVSKRALNVLSWVGIAFISITLIIAVFADSGSVVALTLFVGFIFWLLARGFKYIFLGR
ncbi:MAG: hypothetical protein ACKVOE_10695 [Rickettsiales bacterium]